MQKVISSSPSLCGTGKREKMRKRQSEQMEEGNNSSGASKNEGEGGIDRGKKEVN